MTYVAQVGKLLWGVAPPAKTMKKRPVVRRRKHDDPELPDLL